MASVQPKNAITARKFGILEAYKRNADAVLETPVGATWKVQSPMPHDDTASSIPYGYCHCGCGQKTRIAPKTSSHHGYVKGQPRPYVPGHSHRTRTNPVEVDGTVARIHLFGKLASGRVALVDAADVPLIRQYRWRVTRNRGIDYVVTNKSDYLHRLILNAPAGVLVDHANHDGLDNRRSNIRLATHSQNGINQSGTGRGTSEYRGVFWHESNKGWGSAIRHHGKNRYLGTYETPEAAALVFHHEATRIFGEFYQPDPNVLALLEKEA